MKQSGRRTHRELVGWKHGIELARAVYETTDSFPKTETYGLSSQMRRPAVSVPCNLAEGAARGSRADFLRFVLIARGSLCELETLVVLAHDTRTISGEVFNSLSVLLDKESALLNGLVAYLRKPADSSRLPSPEGKSG